MTQVSDKEDLSLLLPYGEICEEGLDRHKKSDNRYFKDCHYILILFDKEMLISTGDTKGLMPRSRLNDFLRGFSKT